MTSDLILRLKSLSCSSGELGAGGEGSGSSATNTGAGGAEEALLGWRRAGRRTHNGKYSYHPKTPELLIKFQSLILLQVGGVCRTRCSSEADMSAAMLRDSEAGLLMELLTPKSRPRSPHNNPNSLWGHSGSLRRTRNSPSTSPSVAADRELRSLLEMGSDQKVAHQRGRETRTAFPPASPELRKLSPSRTMVPQVQSGTPENSRSPENTNLSYGRHQTQLNTPKDGEAFTVTLTSESNQRSDLNNNENDRLSFSNQEALSPQKTPKYSDLMTGMTRTSRDDHVFGGRIICSDEEIEGKTAATRSMSVVLDRCTLVPELKGFDKTGGLSGQHRDDLIITDLEDEEVKNTSISSSQREEEPDKEDKVVVWCVTGVCEVGGERTVAPAEKDQCSGDNQGEDAASSSPPNFKPSELQLANEKPVPVPISSQPVPVSRCGESALPVSFSRRCPESTSASVVPAVATDASEEHEEPANHLKETEESSTKKTSVAPIPEQATGGSCKNKTAPRRSTKLVQSADRKAGQAAPSKLSTQNSKPRQAGITPSAPKTTSSAGRSKPVRTLTKSESQDMRRVVPITRISQSTLSSTKQPPSHHRSSSKTTVSTSPTTSSPNSASLRPATAPVSRRFSPKKIPESKDSRDNKVLGTDSNEKNQDLKRKPSVRKPVTKSKTQMEEKICRSTLRALTLGGGAGSVSAPATPLHRTKTNSSPPLPGFARSTASSSFRRTQTTLGTSAPPQSQANAGPPKLSPMTTPPSGFTRTGSLRVTPSSRSSDLPNSSSSSTPRRSQSIKSSTRSPLHNSLAPRQGHRRNDSGSFSDKSTHSRDSSKSVKPCWR